MWSRRRFDEGLGRAPVGASPKESANATRYLASPATRLEEERT